jgi:hypothetical protein
VAVALGAELAVAALATALVLISLEGPHLPLLRLLDARRWSPSFRDEADRYPSDDDTAVLTDTAASPDDDQQPTGSR